MKSDRFVKILLLSIALLLAANFLGVTTPLTDNVAYASTTGSFMHVGHVYCRANDFAACKNGVQPPFKFLKASFNGWIYVEDEGYLPARYWLNLNQVGMLSEKP